MKIWMVMSGYEMSPIFDICRSYKHEWHVFIDWRCWPWWDKSLDLMEERIWLWVAQLIDEHGVEQLILPPVRERKFLTEEHYAPYKDMVVPLFTTYIHTYAFRYSLVWKLWLLCDSVHMDLAENIISTLWEEYQLQPNQTSIKSFHRPFALRKKEVRMRKYFQTTYGKRDRMVRKTIKYDLRYFKDAAVDTLIPMDRWMLYYQRILKHMVNRKKLRYHWLDAVQEVCRWLLVWWQDTFSWYIHVTDEHK